MKKSVCKHCGLTIVWNGDYWKHENGVNYHHTAEVMFGKKIETTDKVGLGDKRK